jgi:hypothetical protein
VLRRHSISLVCSVFAVLAMATSAIAACACTHHQTQKTEQKNLSCHDTSHTSETPEVSNDAAGGPRFGESCNCYVDHFQPAITAKSELKKFKSGNSIADENTASIEIVPQVVSVATVTLVHSSFNFYTKILPRFGPARAPPRL